MVTPFTIWIFAAVAIVSGLTGFWAGRFDYWRRNRDLEPTETRAETFDPSSQSKKGFPEEKDRLHNTPFSGQAAEFQYGGEQEPYPYPSDRDKSQYATKQAPKSQGKNMPDTHADQGRRLFHDIKTEPDGNKKLSSPDNRLPENGWKEFGREGRRIPLGWAIGSPMSGEASFFYEGARRGAMIMPQEGMLYAPAAGKIIRLYPTGNAFRLRTDRGLELLVRVGLGTDELEGMYYRPRVVQNEIVNKGKLLIEFDLEKIVEEGYDPSVRISVEEAQDYRDISITDAGHVRVGDDLLWVGQ